MISETTILGIDVSRDWLDGFCLPSQKRFRLPNTANGYIALVVMIQQLSGPVKVRFEATGGHEWVLWALARDDRGWGGDDPPGVLFTYQPGRAGAHAEQILQGFDGPLPLDGYSGYDRLTRPSRKGGAPITVAHCWAHARRKLKEVFDRDGSELAAEGLRQIAELYRIEAEIRGMGPGQRLSVRQTRTPRGRIR